MIKTTGVFFDGISSVPQKIDIEFEERIGQFSFEFPICQSKTWSIEDTSIDQVGQTLNIRIDKSSIQFVKIEDLGFLLSLNDYLKTNGHLSWYQKLINLGIRIHITIALIILGLIVLIYLFIIPWVGEKSIVLIPQEYDNEIGSTFYNEYCKYNTIDSVKSKELNLFANQLDLKNSKEIKFTVIESKTVNAFALPDGHIIVFTGIIDQMKDYDELVGLIGHEVVHVNNRHSMKMLCRNLSGYLFISAILSDVNGVMAIIGDNIRNLQSLSYSRQFERQADFEGFNLMILNKINPNGMTNLFKRLQSKSEFMLPEFLSSHPITKERLNYIDKLIKANSFQVVENQNLKEIFKKLKIPTTARHTRAGA